jgi:hypothetical protein
VGPRAGLDRCGKSRPHRNSIPDRPAHRGKKRQNVSFWYINKMVAGLQTVDNALDLLIIRIGVCYLLDMFRSLVSLSETYFMLH